MTKGLVNTGLYNEQFHTLLYNRWKAVFVDEFTLLFGDEVVGVVEVFFGGELILAKPAINLTGYILRIPFDNGFHFLHIQWREIYCQDA